MPQENLCPHCGAPLPDHARPIPIEDERETQRVDLLASGSNDENFVSNPHDPRVTSAQADSNLGSFVTPSSGPSREAAAAIADRPQPPPSFPSIIVDGSSSPIRSASDDGDEEQPERRNAWASVLLMSYASAITLALIWTLWRTPRAREVPGVAPTTEALPIVGHQAGLSRRVALPEPIVASHLVGLNQSLQVGSLEVTPLEVRRESVGLLRTNLGGQADRKDGGKNALVLRLKLRNTSKDAVFAPLDQAYLRDQEKASADSYVETGTGERIYPFPLAVESEWSIPGQDFDKLRPGEVRVVSIVSAPDAPGEEAGPFLWRVRLRTGIDRNDIIGVRWPDPDADRPE